MGVTHRHLAHPLDVRATAQQHGVANNQTNKNEGESRPDQTKAKDQTNENEGLRPILSDLPPPLATLDVPPGLHNLKFQPCDT